MKIRGTKDSIISQIAMAELEDGIYECEIKKPRQKRSLNANAYYWVLLHQYAEWAGKSDINIHNDILSRFGQVQTEDGKPVTLELLDTVDWKELTYIHLRPTTSLYMSEYDLRTYRTFIVMRGSHEYDTREFSRLVDGLIQDVIGSDAPIETMTPAELALLKGYVA